MAKRAFSSCRNCKHCGAITHHRYDGIQTFPNMTLKLWTCLECDNTHSVKTRHTFEPAGTAESDLLAGTGRM